MISIYSVFVINKRKKEFLINMQNFAIDNPDEVVSINEVINILKKFNRTYINHLIF